MTGQKEYFRERAAAAARMAARAACPAARAAHEELRMLYLHRAGGETPR